MPISHRHRFVFFANPKTGSTTLSQLLDPNTDVQPMRNFNERTPENPFSPHMPPAEAKEWFRQFGWDFDGYTTFVFVRNPRAKLVSLYEHIRPGPEPAPPFGDGVYTVNPDGTGVVRLEDIHHALLPGEGTQRPIRQVLTTSGLCGAYTPRAGAALRDHRRVATTAHT
jgi:hypothetical protein